MKEKLLLSPAFAIVLITPASRTRLLLTGLIGLIFILGGSAINCAAAGGMQKEPSMTKQMPVQIIIKFRNDSRDPSKPYFVRELSESAGAKLSYVRPMSGDTHVFRVENIENDHRLDDVIERLAKRRDVKYVEEDTVMNYQNGK